MTHINNNKRKKLFFSFLVFKEKNKSINSARTVNKFARAEKRLKKLIIRARIIWNIRVCSLSKFMFYLV